MGEKKTTGCNYEKTIFWFSSFLEQAAAPKLDKRKKKFWECSVCARLNYCCHLLSCATSPSALISHRLQFCKTKLYFLSFLTIKYERRARKVSRSLFLRVAGVVFHPCVCHRATSSGGSCSGGVGCSTARITAALCDVTSDISKKTSDKSVLILVSHSQTPRSLPRRRGLRLVGRVRGTKLLYCGGKKEISLFFTVTCRMEKKKMRHGCLVKQENRMNLWTER